MVRAAENHFQRLVDKPEIIFPIGPLDEERRLIRYGGLAAVGFELSSQLGLLVSFMKDGDDKNLVVRSQRNLFTVCSYLATDKAKTPLAPSYTLDPAEITRLEEAIDAINASIPQQKNFILPGGSHEAAIAHVCRTVCRRAERRIFFLAESTKLDPEVLQYMNRLSDYLFVLARKLNFVDGVREKIWDNSCK